MVTEKEFNIIKALVEEEMEALYDNGCLDSEVTTNYLFTLSEIVEKLKYDVMLGNGLNFYNQQYNLP